MKDLKPTVLGFDRYERCRTIGIYSFFRSTKNGEEEIKYDLDACEEYLGETYGITVYQEQVMLCPNQQDLQRGG
jgi:DNA polymerase-3 subunit alpha